MAFFKNVLKKRKNGNKSTTDVMIGNKNVIDWIN